MQVATSLCILDIDLFDQLQCLFLTTYLQLAYDDVSHNEWCNIV